MAIKKIVSYGVIFMLGFYLGSGGCIDRMLGTKQKESGIEKIARETTTKQYQEKNILEAYHGRICMQRY